jgi:crossover junction endodeoxyribonuclease RusA
VISFRVYGTPAAQGSVRAFHNRVVQGGSAERRARLGSWCADVTAAALGACERALEGPVSVYVRFVLTKGSSLPKRRFWVHTRPDLDKLVRATLDGLTGVCFGDDAQVVLLHAAKHYATPGEAPGAAVMVYGSEEIDAVAVGMSLSVYDPLARPRPVVDVPTTLL